MAQILLIDDAKSIRALLRTVLEHGGHVVFEATNGRDGLAQYLKRPVDVVITGIAMPEMSGLELILELTRVASNVKVIAMSGEQRKLEAAKVLGAHQTLLKPFSMEELLGTIRYELAH